MSSLPPQSPVVGGGSLNDLLGETASIIFPRYLSSSAVEEGLSGTDSTIIYFDLSRVVHLDVSALLRILSVVSERRATGCQSRFRLPNDPPARHILRLWRFPNAVSAVTNTPFRLLVDRDDWVYFGEEWPQLTVSHDAASARASVLAYLVERRSFGLTAYRLDREASADRMVHEQTAHWSSYALSNLLAAVLTVPATDFARVVVHELLANVVSLAGPRTVIIGSQLDLAAHPETGAPSGLTVTAWHDGDTLIDRLYRHARQVRQPPPVAEGFAAMCRTAIDTFGGVVIVRGGRGQLRIGRQGEEIVASQLPGGRLLMLGDIVTVRIPVSDGN